MNRLPMLNARKVIQALERDGFFVDHTTGGVLLKPVAMVEGAKAVQLPMALE